LQNKRLSELLPVNPYGSDVDMVTLWSLSESEYQSILSKKKADFEKQEAEKRQHLEEAAAQRERERIAEEQRQNEIKRQQEEQRKAEELAKAGDKAIWADFIKKLEAIEYPKMKSGQYKRIGNIAVEKIEEILSLKPY
jgi:hypothetical protein